MKSQGIDARMTTDAQDLTGSTYYVKVSAGDLALFVERRFM